MGEKEKKKYHRERRQKKKGNWFFNVILLLAFSVFCVSAFQLVKIGSGYMRGQNEYKKIRNLTLKGQDNEDDSQGFQVDFDELLKMNSDTAAWLRFYPEPSEINYPVVQGKDNEEYLHRTFSGNENTLGTLFINVYNNPDFEDKNTIIYGHRMKDGSMFRHLEDYKDKAFWEQNPYFYIYTPDGYELKYHIYSTGVVMDLSDTYLTQFASEEEFREFLDMTVNTAEYDTGIEVGTENVIVTLSTCTSASDDHRYVVRGVLEKRIKCKEE